MTNDSITDIAVLKDVKTLKKLSIEGNYELTVSNVEELQDALPDCTIEHSELKEGEENDSNDKDDTDSIIDSDSEE